MKKFHVLTGVVLFSSLFIASFAQAEIKIGYVDSQAILAKYKEAQDVQAKLKELYKSWEKEAQNMQTEIQKKTEQFQAQSLVLTDKTKQERAQEIQTLQLQFQKFQQDKLGPEGELVKEQNRMMKPIIDKIQKMINKIGDEEGFDYIFDTVNANIVYAGKKQTNLTDRVLQELEKGAATSKTAPKKTN